MAEYKVFSTTPIPAMARDPREVEHSVTVDYLKKAIKTSITGAAEQKATCEANRTTGQSGATVSPRGTRPEGLA